MCLSVVSRVYKRPCRKIRVGWKSVPTLRRNSKSVSLFDGRYRLNEWVEPGNQLPIGWTFKYPSGFHVFERKSDAMQYRRGWLNKRVVRVTFSEVLAVGKNSHWNKGRTFIAKKMKMHYRPRKN